MTFISAKISGDIADEYSGSILYMAPYLSGISGHIRVSDRFYVKLKSADDAVLLEEFAELIRVRSGTSPCGEESITIDFQLSDLRGMILSSMSVSLLELYYTGVFQGRLYGVIDRDVESVERFVAEF